MRAILVLAVVPVLIGIAATHVAKEVRTASLVAVLASVGFVFAATRVADAELVIGWLASLLVLPLPVACAIATVAFLAGRSDRPRARHRRSA